MPSNSTAPASPSLFMDVMLKIHFIKAILYAVVAERLGVPEGIHLVWALIPDRDTPPLKKNKINTIRSEI